MFDMGKLLDIFAIALACCVFIPFLWMFIVDIVWRIRALFGCGPYAND